MRHSGRQHSKERERSPARFHTCFSERAKNKAEEAFPTMQQEFSARKFDHPMLELVAVGSCRSGKRELSVDGGERSMYHASTDEERCQRTSITVPLSA
jgi:hypothetical protein